MEFTPEQIAAARECQASMVHLWEAEGSLEAQTGGKEVNYEDIQDYAEGAPEELLEAVFAKNVESWPDNG